MRSLPPPFGFDDAFTGISPAELGGVWHHEVTTRVLVRHHPWRKARSMARQAGLDPQQLWAAVKWRRFGAWRELPLARERGSGVGGSRFGYCALPALQETLHHVDQQAGGAIVGSSSETARRLSDGDVRERFIVRSLMDESIESSRLEGAVTTTAEALELLRSERPPATPHERMVANNYAAMRAVKGWLDRPLSVEMVCEVQKIVTAGTLKNEADAGRLRSAHDRIRIVDERTGEELFVPPSAEGLRERLEALCAWVNTDHTGPDFVHPIIKACILHFMIGYEHPFCDGNGRTARAFFYWFALRHRYWLFEYLVVSELIRRAYAGYPRAYLDSELDDGDLTYFIAYKLRIIELAIRRLHQHVAEESERVRRSLLLVAGDSSLNLRQRVLLEHALRHRGAVYTAKGHAASNNIAINTARSDLELLQARGLLRSHKPGKQVRYVLAPEAPSLLE